MGKNDGWYFKVTGAAYSDRTVDGHARDGRTLGWVTSGVYVRGLGLRVKGLGFRVWGLGDPLTVDAEGPILSQAGQQLPCELPSHGIDAGVAPFSSSF